MIFLGQASNYSTGRIFRHLFSFGTARDSERLVSALATRYKTNIDQVALYHSGRSALSVAFRALVRPGSPVVIPGLTCIAVVRAARAADCEPVYADIDANTLQYDYTALENTLKELTSAQKSPKTIKSIDKNGKVCYNGIIVAQNTLGLPLDMSKVQALAKKYQFAIVEDLAHSAGRFYPDGREIGTVGVATALSFGKGKAIDTICGGAVILREDNLTVERPVKKPRLASRLRDRWYPVFGGIARTFWATSFGKHFLAALVRMHWIEKSADTALDTETRLTHWQAKLALRQLEALPSTPLREYRLVKKRDEVLLELERAGCFLNEIWYDTPVSPVRYAAEANFPVKKCPNTVKIAQEIINLPTWYPEKKLTRALEIIRPYEISTDRREHD